MTDDDFKRLQWYSRRGMLELDVLLEPFTNQAFSHLSEPDQQNYQRLINCDDPDLFSWFMSDERPGDPDLAKMVDIVLQYARGQMPGVGAVH